MVSAKFEGGVYMANEHLATYLNDHLSGSVATIELLEDLQSAYKGNQLEHFFAELRNDVEADRQELKRLMEHLAITESRARKAASWISGKLAELKMRLDDSAHGSFRLLESLDALELGITGKLALWRALIAAAEIAPALRGALDYERLAQRATEQVERVEAHRLNAAKAAFTR
jgi:hypothetical protein